MTASARPGNRFAPGAPDTSHAVARGGRPDHRSACSPCRSSRRSTVTGCRDPRRHRADPRPARSSKRTSSARRRRVTGADLAPAEYRLARLDPGPPPSPRRRSRPAPRTPGPPARSPSPSRPSPGCATTAGRTACTVVPPVLMSGKAAVPLFTEARKAGPITPPAVIRLLTEAALDPRAQVKQTDTTIAGHHATPASRPALHRRTSTPVSPPTACSAASPGPRRPAGRAGSGAVHRLGARRRRPTCRPAAGVTDRRPATS